MSDDSTRVASGGGPGKTAGVLLLSGGVGGAKLALGLARTLPPGDLGIIANVGDDFEHVGLAISPDIDTLVYTLAGLADPVRGWGRRDETWTFMSALEALGGPAWFHLGDGDLAMHVERTRRLAQGDTLATVTDALRRQLGVATSVWPATNDVVRTRVRTREGWLAFQDYFVARRCEPVVEALEYEGAGRARPCPGALAALDGTTLRAVIIGPSNPLLSIEPILAMPALRTALRACRAPVIAVSPIISGTAVKGPTAKMLRELGRPVDALEAARRYEDLLDGYVLDVRDARLAGDLSPDIEVLTTATLMDATEHKERLARECLAFAATLARRRRVEEARDDSLA